MKNLLIMYMMAGLMGCQSAAQEKTSQEEAVTVTPVAAADQQTPSKIEVVELIQVSGYTYIRGQVNNKETWLAAPTISAKKGDILYYSKGMEMVNFRSKELNRTFPSILFVDRLVSDLRLLQQATAAAPAPDANPHPDIPATGKVPESKKPEKESIKIQLPAGAISLAMLLEEPKKYEGKKVTIRGKITKYTAGVMGKNWIHIQDGTSYNNKFEVVLTTTDESKEGETATFEGVIVLNKDLGYGYFFDILLEDAKMKK